MSITEPDDPPLFDVDAQVQEIEKALAIGHPITVESDIIARRCARLTARQFSLAGQQAAGEALIINAASLRPLWAGDEDATGLMMTTVTMLTGYHLLLLGKAGS